MSLHTLHRIALLLIACVFLLPGSAPGQPAKQPAAIPSAHEVADLLRREPVSLRTWPAWRVRLLGWFSGDSHRTHEAFEAARSFIKSQANAEGELPPPLAGDALAWYFLGSAYLNEPLPADPTPLAARAEAALRRSLALDPNFARAHRNLAQALMIQDGRKGLKQPQIQEALRQAKRLDSTLNVTMAEATVAFRLKQFADAERLLHRAMQEHPDDVDGARMLAVAVVSDPAARGPGLSPSASCSTDSPPTPP